MKAKYHTHKNLDPDFDQIWNEFNDLRQKHAELNSEISSIKNTIGSLSTQYVLQNTQIFQTYQYQNL